MGQLSSYPVISSGTSIDTDLGFQNESGLVVQITRSVDTIAALEVLPVVSSSTGNPIPASNNSWIRVLGYASAGDGAGGVFLYNKASTATVDGINIVSPTVGPGRWVRLSLVLTQPSLYNVLFGSSVGNFFGMTGTGNILFGYNIATGLSTGIGNSAFGYQAGLNLYGAGAYNSFFGYNSGQGGGPITGGYNSGFGYQSLQALTTGTNNSAFGINSILSTASGSNNTGMGVGTLQNIAGSSSNNTAIGYLAGQAQSGLNYCTFIGALSYSSLNGITNSTAIGNGAVVSASNQVVIGNTSVTSTVLNGTVQIPKASILQNGTFTLASGSASLTGLSITSSSVMIPWLKTASGSISGLPYCTAINAGAGTMTIAGGGSDNSTYNYVIIN